MKKQMSVSSLFLLFFVFTAGIGVSVFAGSAFEGAEKSSVSAGGMVVALVASTILMRQQRMKDFVASRPVLWFLFLFNAVVAALCSVALDGVKGVAIGTVMGLVSLGAGIGLVKNPKKNCAPA
ncbi:hypothetical protein [Streptomyces sp. NPDC057690]|uniref:hypothetical protein n=1 Tax=Streptomyces sp. NPDC057690 TaxID=3346214 RepID=UPI00369AD57B